MEPHSAVPLALPMVFTDHCELLPKGLQGVKILGHSAVSIVLLFILCMFTAVMLEGTSLKLC